MNKTMYDSLFIDVISFDNEDVITTSPDGGGVESEEVNE